MAKQHSSWMPQKSKAEVEFRFARCQCCCSCKNILYITLLLPPATDLSASLHDYHVSHTNKCSLVMDFASSENFCQLDRSPREDSQCLTTCPDTISLRAGSKPSQAFISCLQHMFKVSGQSRSKLSGPFCQTSGLLRNIF